MKKILLFLAVTLFVSVSAKAQTCAPPYVHIAATVHSTNISCAGLNNGSATVSITAGNAPYTYNWSPNVSTTNSANNLSGGFYSVTVKDSYCTLGSETIVNGDFSAGNTGFSSSYTYCNTSGCLFPEGYYSVGTNPTFYHSGWSGVDHTTGTGNFLIINGASTAGVSIWCETVTTTPNTNYVYSTWLSSMDATSPAILQFFINGQLIGNTFTAPSTVNTWIQFCTTWNSGSATTANICIINQNTAANGNDFGLDDISFKPLNCVTDSVVLPFTIDNPSPLTSSITTANPCVPSAKDSASGGTGPYSYRWNTIPVQTTATATGLSAGTYTVTATDAHGCTSVSSTTITPPVVVSASASSAICTGGNAQLTSSASGGISYSWSPATGLNNTNISNPIATPTATTTYTVIITGGNGCTGSGTVTITVNQLPVVSFAPFSAPVCITGAPITLTGGSPSGGTYSGSGVSGNIFNPSAAGAGTHTLSYTYTNSNGCTASASTAVTVDPAPTVTISASQTISCASNTIYTGYGPQSVTLIANSGSTVVSYQWYLNGSPITGATTQSITVTSAGVYTVVITDASGCQSNPNSGAGFTLNVVDIRCGHNNDKVIICHVPDCRYPLEVTLCIAPSAIPAHLRNHPCDCLGPCPNPHPGHREAEMDDMEEDAAIFNIAPNPFSDQTSIDFTTFNDGNATLELYDVRGTLAAKLFDGETKAGEHHTILVDGSVMAAGIYFAILRTGDGVMHRKLIVAK